MAASAPADRPAHCGLPNGLRSALLGLWGLLWSVMLHAHPMPESRAWLDTAPDGLRLTLQIPLNRLDFAFGQDLSGTPTAVLSNHHDALVRYLLAHVGARSGTTGWVVRQPTLAVTGTDSSAELEAVLALQAPAGTDSRRVTLLIDAVTHEVRTHRIQVFLRNDWSGGLAGQSPLPLGELDHARTALEVRLGPVRPGLGPLRLLESGALHIAQGSDHLLFLFLLLVVAPLTASAGRWGPPRAPTPALRQVIGVVTAFTVGHTVTLLLGSSGTIVMASGPVEIAVAATIALAALHAWRPLRADGELAMALGFGLIHGMAFSASLSGAGLTALQHGLALLSFNLGIEVMQLALVLLAMPPLLWLARRHPGTYDRLRAGVSAASMLIALWWIAERLEAMPGAAAT